MVSRSQIRSIRNLSEQGYQVLGPADGTAGGRTLLQAPDGKKFYVGADGELKPAPSNRKPKTAGKPPKKARPSNHDERSLILSLLRLGCGHGIDLFAMLSIMQMEDGNFGVYYDPDGDQPVQEWLFDDCEKAVDFFVDKRMELQLGYDYEVPGGTFYQEKAAAKP